MERNQRKIQILRILEDNNDWLSAKDILEKIKSDVTLTCVMALLLRYKKYQLVYRENIDGVYSYIITPKGKTRLRFFDK
ncbi:MAG: hypothetical protein ACTSQ1_01385 [Promethearchaeota archaeon]